MTSNKTFLAIWYTKLVMRLLTGMLATHGLMLPAQAADSMKLAVTTSFNNSGLSDVLLPEIKNDLNLDVQLLIVGTGQALKLGRAGDVDAILVHSRQAEEKFVSQGFAPYRREIMYNDFILVGPDHDPADIKHAATTIDAFQRIHSATATFVSRGDDSGTHRKERSFWQEAHLQPDDFDAAWYRSTGSGMGATLNTASAMDAYALADRASWLNFANKGNLVLLYSGDRALFNQYAYLPVSSQRFAHVNHQAAKKLETWLTSDKGQRMIKTYAINGEMVFTPNAAPSKSD